MLSKWILIAETVVLGLALALSIPMWAMIPMLFGITEFTPSEQARPIYILLIAFPIVAIACLALAWRADPGSVMRWVMMIIPIAHLAIMFKMRLIKT